MLHCWKKKRNHPLDRDPVCEGLLEKYYVRYIKVILIIMITKVINITMIIEIIKVIKIMFQVAFLLRLCNDKRRSLYNGKREEMFIVEEKKYEILKDDYIELDSESKVLLTGTMRGHWP